jgi:hypothetical protein
MRQVISVTLVWLLIALLVGCSVPQKNSPVATPLPKQPEPRFPRIGGQFTGVSDDLVVRFSIYTLSGRRAGFGSRLSNGQWEAVVTEASGHDYFLTAEAEGYVSQPLRYTLHVSGTTVTVDNPAGEPWVGEEVMSLDFHFVPLVQRTP